MRRGGRIFWILGACGLALVVAALWPRAKEPVYKGKALSEWLQAYELGSQNEVEKEVHDVGADDAIREMGTNALPWLVRWLSYERPAWRDGAEGVANRFFPGRDAVLRWLRRRDSLAPDAVWGFKILGPRASPAVPDLVHLINDPHRSASAELAMYALSEMGEAGFSPLLKILESRQKRRDLARRCIMNLYGSGVDISPAVPAILLQDHEEHESTHQIWFANAVFDIPVLAEKPEKFLLALTNCLRHPNDVVRLEAACAIGRFGAEGRSATDALTVALTDSAVLVREAATNALREISSGPLRSSGEP